MEVDSQVVTKTTNSTDYFLIDYLYKHGNFNLSYITTAFNTEGYYDSYNFDSQTLKQSDSFLKTRLANSVKKGDKYRWEFAFTPNSGFLSNPEPLLKNCELVLSFKRADPNNAVLCPNGDESLEKPIDIVDVYAISEYISSEHWKNYFSDIDHRPIIYEYDDCEVLGEVHYYFLSCLIQKSTSITRKKHSSE